ncbi:MAG: DUF4252 domain-containing protein [Bryobacteraceae bacterium]
MRTATLPILILSLLVAPLACAQKVELKLDGLAAKAAEKAELDLDPSLVSKMMEGGKLPNIAPSSAKEVRIRNYKFAKEGEYSDKDLDSVRKQLAEGSGWSRVVHVKDKKEAVELYVFKEADQIRAFLLIACQPAELSVVYVAGEMTPEQLKALVSSRIQYQGTP